MDASPNLAWESSFWTTENVDPTWLLNTDDARVIKEHDDITLTSKRAVAYVVSNGAQLTLNAADLAKAVTSSNGLDDIEGPAIAPLAAIDGGKITLLHGSITTSDTPGGFAYAGGEGTELHIQYTYLASSAMVSYGVVAFDSATVHARNVKIATAGFFDCAFSTGKNGAIYLNEFNTSSHGPLACSFDGKASIYMDHVSHTSENWPVLFLKDAPGVVIVNSELSNTVEDRPVICNYVESGSSPGTKIEVVDSKLIAPVNGAIFELRNSGAQVWLTHTEIFTEHADFIWVRCGLEAAGECEGPIVVDINVADSWVHGDAVAWDDSIINISIDPYSIWTGSTAWPGNSGPSVNVVVEGSWQLTRDTYVQQLVSPHANLDNIVSNGYTIYYNPGVEANAYLQGREITLHDGGHAKPFTFDAPSMAAPDSEDVESGEHHQSMTYTLTVFTTIHDDGLTPTQAVPAITEEPTFTEDSDEPTSTDDGKDPVPTDEDDDEPTTTDNSDDSTSTSDGSYPEPTDDGNEDDDSEDDDSEDDDSEDDDSEDDDSEDDDSGDDDSEDDSGDDSDDWWPFPCDDPEDPNNDEPTPGDEPTEEAWWREDDGARCTMTGCSWSEKGVIAGCPCTEMPAPTATP